MFVSKSENLDDENEVHENGLRTRRGTMGSDVDLNRHKRTLGEDEEDDVVLNDNVFVIQDDEMPY